MSYYDNRKYISAINSDIAHTCGNVCSIITNDLIGKFKPNFFKHVHNTSEIAVSQFKKIKDLTDLKWKKPYLIVQPRLLINDVTEQHIDVVRRMNDTSMYNITRETEETAKFFCDDSKGILLDYAIERLKMSFRFSIFLSTEYQQYCTAAEIRNGRFRLENAYYKPTIIETVIPDNIIKRISKDSGIDIINNGSPNKFLTYLNNKSRIPITLDFQPATGKYTFRLMGGINILMMYTDMDVQDPQENNLVKEDYPIELTVKCEFNYPSRFFYVTDEDSVPVTGYEEIEDDEKIDPMNEENVFFYTIQQVIIPNNDVNDKQLKTLLAMSVDNEKEDVTDLIPLMEPEYLEIIDKYKEEEIDPRRFINIVIYENDHPFNESNYSFNLFERKLYLRNTKKYNTYRIALYVDNIILNDYKLRNYKYE